MPVCYLALGGNTGDVAATFDGALKTLHNRGVDVLCRSDLYRTTPIGTDAGDPFLNAAAEVTTTLEPHDLLKTLQQVEAEFGRERTIHWGPRTLDIDLILYGFETIRTDDLTVPHPAAWYRRFVIDPLHEIAPQAFHPVQRTRVEVIRRRLLTRPLPIVIADNDPSRLEAIRAVLNAAHDERIRFVPREQAVLVLKPTNDTAPDDDPRVILIENSPNGEQNALDVLNAVFDEPQRVDRTTLQPSR